jgi:hypothetical protein
MAQTSEHGMSEVLYMVDTPYSAITLLVRIRFSDGPYE